MKTSCSTSTEFDAHDLQPYRCPFCGSDDVVYQVPAWAVHQLWGLRSDGTLIMHSDWKPNVTYDDPSLLCRHCGEATPFPTYLKEDFF